MIGLIFLVTLFSALIGAITGYSIGSERPQRATPAPEAMEMDAVRWRKWAVDRAVDSGSRQVYHDAGMMLAFVFPATDA